MTFLSALRSSLQTKSLSRRQASVTIQLQRRMGHNVRIIVLEDLPNGKAYKGDVCHVKAGFARNHLIPQKYALYATPQNFKRVDMKDPDLETPEERAARLASEAMSDEKAAELKAADILKHYLRNKEVSLYRKVDPDTQALFPGMVDVKVLKKKLSKQLKIDLEEREAVHILDQPLEMDEYSYDQLLDLVVNMDTSENCSVQIRKLGHYVARISLAGGYSAALRFVVHRT